MFHLMSPQVRLGLSQSRRVVSSQAILDSSDDDDFDVAKSQPGFPMAKKKRGNLRTQISSNHVAAPKKVVSPKRKPGSSTAKRIVHAMSDSDSDSDFDMEKYVLRGFVRVLFNLQWPFSMVLLFNIFLAI